MKRAARASDDTSTSLTAPTSLQVFGTRAHLSGRNSGRLFRYPRLPNRAHGQCLSVPGKVDAYRLVLAWLWSGRAGLADYP
jgi:hypothetical protein